MIKLKVDDTVYTIATQLSEINLQQFANLCKLTENEYRFKTDSDIDSIIALSNGLTIEMFDRIPLPDVKKIVTATNSIAYDNVEMQKQIEIDGVTYATSFDPETKEFEFSAKEFSLLQRIVDQDKVTNSKDFAAVLFREPGNDFSKEALARRAEVFNQAMTMDYLYPYIVAFQIKFAEYYAV